MLDTLVPLLTAKLKLATVAVAAVALSTSAVAVTTVSNHEPLPEETEVSLEVAAGDLGLLDDAAVATPTAGGDEPVDEPVGEPADGTAGETGGEPVEGSEPPSDAGLPECPADVKNHGQYVSSVARDRSVSGREHGARVSAAAQSDCGKKSAAPEPAEEPAEETAEETAEEPDETVGQQSVPAEPAPAKAEKKAAKAETKTAKKAASAGKKGAKPAAAKGGKKG